MMKDFEIDWNVKKLGPRILEAISMGLYQDKLCVVREFVQNSADEYAKKVEIEIQGNDLIIIDDGEGMDKEGIESFTDVAKSIKALEDDEYFQGFRGIGTYSALAFADKIKVETSRRGSSRKISLTIDCKSIRRRYEDDRIDVLSLLKKNVKATEEKETSNAHYTIISLLNFLDRDHIDDFKEDLNKYLGQTLPVNFPDEFDKKYEIDDFRKEITGWRNIDVYLDNDQIVKPFATNLGKIMFVNIENEQGKLIGKIWYGISRKGAIKNEFAKGLIYVWRGFSIGDRMLPKKHAKRFHDARYGLCTGEIYVFDNPHFKPNTARDGFTADFEEYFQPFVHRELRKLENDVGRRQKKSEAKRHVRKDIDEMEKTMNELKKVDKRYSEYSQLVAELDRKIKTVRKRDLALRSEGEIGKEVKRKLKKAYEFREGLGWSNEDFKKKEERIQKELEGSERDFNKILKSDHIPLKTARLLKEIRNAIKEEFGEKNEEYSGIVKKIVELTRKIYEI